MHSGELTPRPLRHLALIPDGNRRWAKGRGLPPEAGHEQGFLRVTPRLLEAIWQKGVHATTLWLFSTDNWQRPEPEVRHLMEVFQRLLSLLEPLCGARSVEVRRMGRKDRIPGPLLAALEGLEESTRGQGRHVLNLALDYGGRDEIVAVVRRLLREAASPEEVDEARLDRLLASLHGSCPAPDLIVRTSGELRLSGFMPLQSVHSELYFTDTLYPDLAEEEIARAISSYRSRDRRFGC
jgi:undecaprenyl diphosphate synthase